MVLKYSAFKNVLVNVPTHAVIFLSKSLIVDEAWLLSLNVSLSRGLKRGKKWKSCVIVVE